jgi:hypothetical protein
MEIAFLWFAFAIVVGVAADARGRHGVGWFFLALIISPVIAFLLVLVMRRQETAPTLTVQPFEPDGIHAGIPYRVMHDGSINAIMQGANVRFADHAKFSAATGAPLPEEQKLATLVALRTPPLQKSWIERVGAEYSRDGWPLLLVLAVGAIVAFVVTMLAAR